MTDFLLTQDQHRRLCVLSDTLKGMGLRDTPDLLDDILSDVPLHVPLCDPPEITDEQLMTLWRKWKLIRRDRPTFIEFLSGVVPVLGTDKAVSVQWCGMWLCIETNGESIS